MQIPGPEVDRRLTGHLQPRNTCTSLLGKGPGVPWFRERSSFLARALFYGSRCVDFGFRLPGLSATAGAPRSHRENNPGLRTHVLGAPSVRAVASTFLLPTAFLKGASVRSGSPMGLLLPGLS